MMVNMPVKPVNTKMRITSMSRDLPPGMFPRGNAAASSMSEGVRP